MITRRLTSSLKKCARKAYFSQLFTWGETSANLGHEETNSVPTKVRVKDAVKVSMGKYHTAFLKSNGQLYTFGDGTHGALGNGKTEFFDSPRKVGTFENSGVQVEDFDCGAFHVVALASNGSVYTWGRSTSVPSFLSGHLLDDYTLGTGETEDLRTPTLVSSLDNAGVTQVSAGDRHTAAIADNGNKLFMWGTGSSGVFCDPYLTTVAYPTEINEVQAWLSEIGQTIKSVKCAGDSTMVLTSNNELWGWGGNDRAQLANNHNKLHSGFKGVFQPTQIVSQHNGTIVDFDLSEDVLVFYTDKNLAYWAGRYEQFVTAEVEVPFEETISSVGASKSGFGITTEEGKLFSFGETLKTEKFFFDQKLSLSDQNDFLGLNIQSVGGCYGNTFALAN